MIGTTAAILGAAAIGAGSSALAAKSANKAVSNATAAETVASNQALDLQNRQLDLQKQQYEQQRSDYAPWREVGVGALQQLARTFNIKPPTSTYGAPAPAAAPAAAQTYGGQPFQTGGAAINPGFGYDSSGNFANDPNAMGPGAVGGISPDFYPQASITNGQVGAVTAQPEPQGQASPVAAQSGAQGQFGDFFASPDYQFRVNQGITAITGNRAARGLIDSGSLGKGLINYGQRAGAQEFGSWFDRLSTLAGYGKSATDGSVAAGQANVNAQGNTANNSAGIIQNQGQNLSSSYQSKAGISGGLINGVGTIGAGLINQLGGRGSAGNYAYNSTGGQGNYGGTPFIPSSLEGYY